MMQKSGSWTCLGHIGGRDCIEALPLRRPLEQRCGILNSSAILAAKLLHSLSSCQVCQGAVCAEAGRQEDWNHLGICDAAVCHQPEQDTACSDERGTVGVKLSVPVGNKLATPFIPFMGQKVPFANQLRS